MRDTSFYVQPKGKVFFENGSSLKLGQLLHTAGKKQVLCIFDKGVESTGKIGPILHSLEEAGIQFWTFNDVRSDAPVSVISACATLGRTHQIDAIVGIGGGSSIDTAKAVNVLLTNTLPVETYFDHSFPKKPGVFLAAIPTTAGTGSEMTKSAVVYNEVTGMKASLYGANCSVDLAIIDPSLTLGMPAWLTAGTGMDTLAHMISPYLRENPSPWCDTLHERGIRIVGEYLPRAVTDIQDLEARTQLSFACLLAGTAMCDCPPHLEHAIGHAIGVRFHIHHGVACALALPVSVQYLAAQFPERVLKIGALLGFHTDPAAPQGVQLNAVVRQIDELNHTLGIGRLKDRADVSTVDAQLLAETIEHDMCFRSVPGNPTHDAVLNMVQQLYS